MKITMKTENMKTENRNKLTIDEAIEQEAINVADAYFSHFDDPLQFAGEKVKDLFFEFSALMLDDQDIRWILDSASGDPREWGYYSDDKSVIIPVGEIEIQFEGEPSEFFDNPDDWTIDGDLAYCSMPSVLIPIDLEKVEEELRTLVYNRLLDHVNIILSDARGVYIPRDFVDMLSDEEKEFQEKVNGFDSANWIHLSSPDEEYYWEVWNELLNSFVSENGTRIYQNGDLYEISPAMDKEPIEFVEIFWEMFVQ
jgi:hypothetical protein